MKEKEINHDNGYDYYDWDYNDILDYRDDYHVTRTMKTINRYNNDNYDCNDVKNHFYERNYMMIYIILIMTVLTIII